MAPTPESSAAGAAVRFTTDTAADMDPTFPLRVDGVGEACFEQAFPNNETASTFQSYLRTNLTAEQAIEEALTIVATAPAFDGIDIERVEHPTVTAEVTIQADLGETLDRMERETAIPDVDGWINRSTDTWHISSGCAGRTLYRTTMSLVDALGTGVSVCGKCSQEFLKYSREHAERERDGE